MAQAGEFVLPDELYYHPEDHLWVRMEGPLGRVGLDQLAQRSAGKVRHISLKPPGRPLLFGKPFGSLEAGKYVGPLRAPLAGKVVEINQGVLRDPGLVNRDPYGEGWLVIIEAEDSARDLARLVHGVAVQPWLEASVEAYRREGLLKT